MNRLLSFLGSILFAVALVVGTVLPLQTVQAANTCSFRCAATMAPGAGNCNPQHSSSAPCTAQCDRFCGRLGMSRDTSASISCTDSTVTGGASSCGACTCTPNHTQLCSGLVSGGRDPDCAQGCTDVCSTSRNSGRLSPGERISCSSTPAPTCVAASRTRSEGYCRACISECRRTNQSATDASCLTTCQTRDLFFVCQDFTATNLGFAATPSSGSSGSGRSGSTGRTGSGTTGGSTGGGAPTGTPAPAQEGVCNFTCQPQIAPSATACTTDEGCATRCRDICGRSFTGGTCVTSGATAPRCGASVGGAPRQCIFECTIGASAQERTCNPQGTDDAAPARVCGGFCEASCRAASIGERVPSSARFCGGSVATCRAPGGTTSPGGSNGGTTPGESGGNSGNGGSGSVTLGAGGGGSRLVNPLTGIDSVASLVGRLVKGILGIVGSVALLMFIYGGVRWILSAGDPKDISASRNIIRNATIGMVLIFFSYTISSVILGLLGEVGGGQTNTGSSSQTGALATCVEYAVSHGHMGRNEAQDSTTPDWACRQTQPSERTDRTRCITRGCPTQGATVLCCAPAAGTAPDSTPTPSGAPGSSGAPAPTGGTELLAAAPGCQTVITSEFHLRATDTTVSSGRTVQSGTRVEVVRTGNSVRSGTRIHFVRLVPPNGTPSEGWTFLTPAQITACARP